MPRSSPTRVPRPLVGLLVMALGLTGCKKGAPTAVPGQGSLPDDIAALEAELQANANRLQNEGIRVAQVARERPAEGAEAAPASEPSSTPLGVGAEDEGGDQISEQAQVSDEVPSASDPVASSPPEPESPMPRTDSAQRDTEERASRDRRVVKRREKKAVADRCERICDLAAATCDLADHVCALARRHPDEPRYEDACVRAETQCEAASAACNECAG